MFKSAWVSNLVEPAQITRNHTSFPILLTRESCILGISLVDGMWTLISPPLAGNAGRSGENWEMRNG